MVETEEVYDFIIIGTGPVESIVSCILSSYGNKVLVVDKNDSYGSEFSTYTLSELNKQSRGFITTKVYSEDYYDEILDTSNTDWNIDVCPKLLILESDLRQLLVKYGIDNMVDFAAIKSSFIYTDRLHKIPRSEATSMTSDLVGIFEKARLIKFFYNVRSVVKNTESLKNVTMEEQYDKYGLSKISRSFIGHAIAMNVNDDYLKRPAIETYRKIRDYVQSVISYSSFESPFAYPNYGLSDICQAFVRKASLNNATFMLNAKFKLTEISKDNKRSQDTMLSFKVQDFERKVHNFNTKNIIINKSADMTDKVLYSKGKSFIYTAICICKKNKIYPGSRNITFLDNEYLGNDVFCVILDHETKSCPEGYEVVILSTKSKRSAAEVFNFYETNIFDKILLIKVYFKQRPIPEPSVNLRNIFYTLGADESPLMNSIYDEVLKILDYFNIPRPNN